MFAIAFYLLALVGGFAHIYLNKKRRRHGHSADLLLTWWLAVALGCSGLFAASGHLFIPDEVAATIGWAPGSPFQREVGFANLAFGTLGILSAFIRGTFREATVIGLSIFLIGDAVGHVIEIVETGNMAVNNAGPALYADVIGPVVAAILLVVARRAEKPDRSAADNAMLDVPRTP